MRKNVLILLALLSFYANCACAGAQQLSNGTIVVSREIDLISRKLAMRDVRIYEFYRQLGEEVDFYFKNEYSYLKLQRTCNIDTYLYNFAYEIPQKPSGALIVAAKLALYANLTRYDQNLRDALSLSSKAADLAKKILNLWENSAFYYNGNDMLKDITKFCDGSGNSTPAVLTQVGLQLSRGIPYYVTTIDLLRRLSSNSDNNYGEKQRNFLHKLSNAIKSAFYYRNVTHPDLYCNKISNHVASIILGLSTIYAYNREYDLLKSLIVRDKSTDVPLTLNEYISRAVYEKAGSPVECYTSTMDGKFRVITHVAEGEIVDNYRNQTDLQSFGYPAMVIFWLATNVRVINNASLEEKYKKKVEQKIYSSLKFYSCWIRSIPPGVVVGDRRVGCDGQDNYVGSKIDMMALSVDYANAVVSQNGDAGYVFDSSGKPSPWRTDPLVYTTILSR